MTRTGMIKKRRQRGEATFQINVVRMLRTAGFFVFAVPNGWGKMNLIQAGLAKAEGIMPGVSDLIVLLPKGKAVFVELKNPNGKGCQSVHQKRFMQQVLVFGFEYYVWSNWEQVQEFIAKNA